MTPPKIVTERNWRYGFVDRFGLERNIAITSTGFLLLGVGEELWKKFLPKYMESLGATTPVIGFFGTTKDFLDAIYHYPGGWLADHWGDDAPFCFLSRSLHLAT
jgi:hypothetical protein